MNTNNAEIILQIRDLQDIKEETILGAIEELGCSIEDAPFYIIFCNTENTGEDIDAVVAKKYAEDILLKIGSATGLKYSKIVSSIIVDSFILKRCETDVSIDEKVNLFETFINKYDGFVPGTSSWFIVESIKRDLLVLYSCSGKHLNKARELIYSIEKENAIYQNIIKSF